MLLALSIIALAILVVGIALYNQLVRSRNRVDTAWSDIDVQLQRRHDLIPNLVKAVDQYASYERATLAAITELRSQAKATTDVEKRGEVEEELGAGVQKLIALAESYPDLKAMQQADVRARGAVEEKLSAGIERLLALAESYPGLKANENFLELQNDLVETENYLQFARRYYNGSVRDYNTLTEVVPSNIVASFFNFTTREFFQKASDDVANVPLVKLGSVE